MFETLLDVFTIHEDVSAAPVIPLPSRRISTCFADDGGSINFHTGANPVSDETPVEENREENPVDIQDVDDGAQLRNETGAARKNRTTIWRNTDADKDEPLTSEKLVRAQEYNGPKAIAETEIKKKSRAFREALDDAENEFKNLQRTASKADFIRAKMEFMLNVAKTRHDTDCHSTDCTQDEWVDPCRKSYQEILEWKDKFIEDHKPVGQYGAIGYFNHDPIDQIDSVRIRKNIEKTEDEIKDQALGKSKGFLGLN